MTSTSSNHRLSAGMLASLLALTACGGGGGGSTTSAPPASAPVSTVGPAVSQGMITALGSVFVNGVEYATSGTTTVLVDGVAGTLADLTVGKVARVKGSSDDHTRQGSATQIEVRDALQGTIDSVDNLGKTITVLGQLVRFEDNVTHVGDDTVKLFTDAAFLPNDMVEVHGFADGLGGLRATRVDRIGAGEFEVKGFISSLAATSFNLTLTKGGAEVATVNFLAANLPAGAVEGSLVEVFALAAPVTGGALPAITGTTITLEDPLGAEGQKVEVEGIVSNGVLADFEVNGQEVITNATTLFEGGLDSDFAIGERLEAEGPLDANGAIVATRIRFVSEIKLEGDVTGFLGGLNVLGLTVGLDPFTRIDIPVDLNLNKHVVIKAVLNRNGAIMATRVDVLPASNHAQFQGPVSAADAGVGTLTILGQTLVTNAGTQWRTSSTATEAPTTKAAFFAQLVPHATVVKVKWNAIGLISDPVNEAEIEQGN